MKLFIILFISSAFFALSGAATDRESLLRTHEKSTRFLQRTCNYPIDVFENGGPFAIDGSASDWRKTPGGSSQTLDSSNTYFLANMYEAGNPTKDLLSRAYGSLDCAKKILYVLVHAEGCAATKIETSTSDLWLKIYDVANSVVQPVSFQIIYENGVPKGWEASYNLSSGAFNFQNEKCFRDVEIHASVPNGRTSSTGKKNVAPKDPIALQFRCVSPSPSQPPSMKPSRSPSVPPRTEPCDEICDGEYPYGCDTRLDWPWKYMCAPNRRCYYTYTEDDEGPFDDNSEFCTYKTQVPSNPRERPPIADPPTQNGSCDGICPGSYPYGCAENIEGAVRYMCLPGGGCYYAKDEFDLGPYDDNSAFCVYRELTGGR